MKKKLISALLCLTLVLTLMPATAFAAPQQLSNVDLVIELPKAGDILESETTVKIVSMKSGNIDLLANGAGILYTTWDGNNSVNEKGEYVFTAGSTYFVTIKLAFDTTSKAYCAKYKTVSGDIVADADTFTATVNGVQATTSLSSSYFPTITVSLTIPGERFTETEKAEMNTQLQTAASELAKTRRTMYTPRTQAEADAAHLSAKATTVVTMNDPSAGYDLGYLSNFSNIGHLIMDVDDSAYAGPSTAADFTNSIYLCEYIQGVWLSEKVDACEFIKRMDTSLRTYLNQMPRYLGSSKYSFYTADATVYIPESAASTVRNFLSNNRSYIQAYSIKTYSGNDVYAAQKAGDSAAKDLCTTHKYDWQIMSADRAYTYSNCQQAPLWYYSCSVCGKCEYNPNHVAENFSIPEIKPNYVQGSHPDASMLYESPNDESYIGVNAAGQHIYWLSCVTCGKSYRYLQQHISAAQFANTGSGASLSQYQAFMNAEIKRMETLALNSTEVQANMFAEVQRSTAKASDWAQGDVNLAMNDNLLDTSLLGNDYTKSISRLQFCSIAVRLAEELTGKSITPAAAGTFSDTDSSYVLKAYAAGITTGTSDTTFSPNSTLTRQQMGTFLYRTLRYVEKNSDYKYTSYSSKLSSFSDSGQVESWAQEAMAFMNALNLIKGTTTTTLAPNNTCTIEQAIIVAGRSVYAHLIGWYQVSDSDAPFSIYPSAAGIINTTPPNGEYIWVTGRRMGVYNNYTKVSENLPYTFVQAINPYTGQEMYVCNRYLVPVRN